MSGSQKVSSLWRLPGPAGVSLAGVLTCTALLVGCATTVPEAPPSHVPERETPYFLDPLASYPLAASPELEHRVRRAYAVLAGGGDLPAARAAMIELLEVDPGFHPARLVLAQIAVLDEQPDSAFEELSPVADELPDYLACQLLLGRLAEQRDDPETAFRAYRRSVGASSLARERAAALEPRVTEILLLRIGDLVDRGRFEEAASELDDLEAFSSDEVRVLETRRNLAFAEGDVEREAEVLRRLAEIGVDDPSVEERLADLSLFAGDIRSAIDTFENLIAKVNDAAQAPDARLLDKLERAKFLWRLQLQPAHVQEIASKSVLTRAELATLLYWLVPSVRYAEVTDPPIATDILDHPRRLEILPVMFLGLVPVDETLHRFFPDREATRSQTLASLLGLLGLAPAEFSCLTRTEARGLSGSQSLTCTKAAQCRLIPERADCLPGARISGPDALDLFRRTLDSLGTQ